MPISSTEPAVASALHTGPSPSQLRCAISPKGRGKNVRRLWWRHNTARGTCGTAPYGATPADTPRSHGGSQGILPPLGAKSLTRGSATGRWGFAPAGYRLPHSFVRPHKKAKPRSNRAWLKAFVFISPNFTESAGSDHLKRLLVSEIYRVSVVAVCADRHLSA